MQKYKRKEDEAELQTDGGWKSDKQRKRDYMSSAGSFLAAPTTSHIYHAILTDHFGQVSGLDVHYCNE